MTIKTTIATIAAISVGAAALAHQGATGIVLERMQGMSAMKDAMKTLTPIMRGQTDYDAAVVRETAKIIASHAGETMTALFPEDGMRDKTYARNTIWTDWDDFEDLSMRLESLAMGLEQAAGNGLGADAAPAGASQMMGGSASMMGGAPDASAMMGGSSAMMGGGSANGDAPLDLAELAGMPADQIFTRIGKTCSACHSRFRVEKD